MFKLIKTLFNKKQEPTYANCLQHRTWLQRQVDNELLKRQLRSMPSYSGTVKREENWYAKYL